MTTLSKILFCALGAASVVQTSAEDWPSLRGPDNTGISSANLTSLQADPERIWKASGGPKGNASVVVADGLAYTFGTGKVNVLCLNAENGEKVWSKTVGEWHGNQTPTLAGGKLYLQSFMNEKDAPKGWCLDAKTGDEIWKKDLPMTVGKRHWGQAGSPLVVGDLVIFNVGGGTALKHNTGETVWGFEGLPGMATPVLFKHKDKDAVALFLGEKLLARDLKSGKELWSIPWQTNSAVNAHQPLIFDGKILINSGYGLNPAMYDVSSGTPKEVWKFGKGRAGHAFAASILHGGSIYGFFENALACLDPKDGSIRWRDRGTGSLLLIDGQLLRVSEKGEMQIAPVSAKGFEPTLTAQVHGGTVRNNPAYVDGKLFLKNDSGEVVCVRIAK